MMNKQHIASRLSEMLGRRVDVGVYQHIEDIWGWRFSAADANRREITQEVQAIHENGDPAFEDNGQPVIGQKKVITIEIMPIAHRVKVGENVINDGEQYAYADDAGKQVYVDEDLIAQAVEYLKAHPPAADPVPISYSELRAKMTPAERQKISELRRTVWQIDDFVTWAAGSNVFDLNSSDVTEAKAAMIDAGVFTAERAAEVFSK